VGKSGQICQIGGNVRAYWISFTIIFAAALSKPCASACAQYFDDGPKLELLDLDPRVVEVKARIRLLSEQIDQLSNADKHAEALPLAEDRVALAKMRYGEDHSEYAAALKQQAIAPCDVIPA